MGDEVMTSEGDLLGDKSHGSLVQRLLLLLWRHERNLLRLQQLEQATQPQSPLNCLPCARH